ncbi:MAG TPA: peptidylprolyl isomerase [Plasticicumulans sp.]|uniref:peptidylprolyl isomerase n=1 Tax=Plasticicumulans sp. TaxID=2307179 RepID=UPI002BAAB66D|nr:peptidylprolyl isomerase [Plasticicumulans sp.]MBS0600240.1 peptidyl-prolyl cis-trans isomerase [Pseudomonadota bacterium]HMV39320.1 peptidylprolyl isomerase [Plasticicumulans sp.]HMW43200.1 peptidylprolyl isomerase [Plasticicumulans sp.]HMZ11425.1 peptidylprolyl isomerase [Plasticicumulans sp.]HNG50367.1 peptidylprolyl isomerase [Plasticicumulans sp.]
MIRIQTSLGVITLELDAEHAPATTANFEQYVRDGFYAGTIFHRVIPNFMVQGGGMLADMSQKSTRAPIRNEAKNGLKNARGSIAMARTSDPHSATAQFFINVKDNGFLDHPGQDGWGYCVFGKVIEGMDVVDAIVAVPTANKRGHQNVPVEPVLIEKMEIVE